MRLVFRFLMEEKRYAAEGHHRDSHVTNLALSNKKPNGAKYLLCSMALLSVMFNHVNLNARKESVKGMEFSN
jgi:uncharacterized protein (DUF1015 family)